MPDDGERVKDPLPTIKQTKHSPRAHKQKIPIDRKEKWAVNWPK